MRLILRYYASWGSTQTAVVNLNEKEDVNVLK